MILGGHFERRERGILADLLRDDLIDGGAAEDFGAVRGLDAIQPHGVAEGVTVLDKQGGSADTR